MLRRQDIPLFRHCHMGINLRNMNGTMPKHFLNVADVNIRFQEAGGESVAEHMRGNAHFNAGKRGIFTDCTAHRLVG